MYCFAYVNMQMDISSTQLYKQTMLVSCLYMYTGTVHLINANV